jgi:multiple sugar transport system substrate-binding protein
MIRLKALPILFFLFVFFLFLLSLQCAKKDNEEKIIITWWQFWTDPNVKPKIDELISEFEKENPKIKVEITDLTWSDGHEKIVIAFSSNSAPDVIELGSDWVPEFSSQGVLADVTSDAKEIKDQYLMWDPVTYRGKIFGFPWILDTRVLFYNKDLMKKANLDPEKPPSTWDELLEYCQKVNRLKPQAYGFGANSAERHRLYKKFLPFFWSNGGKILSDNQKESLINSFQGIEALEFYKKLTQEGTIDIQGILDEKFKNNQIGFLISGGWLLNDIQKNYPQLNFGVCLIPRPEKEQGGNFSFTGGEYLVINKKSLYKEEAERLIKFLIKKDNCLKLCKVIGSASPSAKDASLDPYYQNNKNLLIFQEQLRSAISPPAHSKWVYMEEIIERAVENVMYDKKTPKEALDEAKIKIDRILQ